MYAGRLRSASPGQALRDTWAAQAGISEPHHAEKSSELQFLGRRPEGRSSRMSRLFALQLAPSVTSEILRDHFATLDLHITDAKVISWKRGSSRGMGFIGYKTKEEAEKAKDYFDGTYLEGRRIKVTWATEAKQFSMKPHKFPTEPPKKRQKLDHPAQSVASTEPAAVAPPAEYLDDSAYLAARRKRKVGEGNLIEESKPVQEEREEAPAPTRRLFLRNLAFTATEADLRQAFEGYGELTEARLIIDQANGKSKGLAYLAFETGEQAEKAATEMDGTFFQGRLLHILPAAERTGVVEQPANKKKGTVKQEKQGEKKQNAGQSSHWASLYLNADSVAQAAAAKNAATKADVVGPDVGDAAVRLALAETALIAETKDFLDQHGISTQDAQTRPFRSDTTLLVKNLPFATSSATLESLFSAHGTLRKLELSPSGLMAIVEYSEAKEASSAMRNLAYRRIGKAPIYLETAPLAVMSKAQMSQKRAAVVANTQAAEQTATEEGEAEATLYLKNLAWATTDSILAGALRHLPGFIFARVQTKDDPKKPGQKLSMGFGFVGFRSKKEAENALPTVNGLMVDGHALQAAFARRNDTSAESRSNVTTSERASAKVIVKNVAFEVTKKEIRELIGAHGQVKSLRMPRKADRGTRGFAFVEFASKRDAQTAIAALSHTHLLGRHLVFEYATDQIDEQKLSEEARRTLDTTSLNHKKRKTRGFEAALSGKTADDAE